jgi:prepilin-type N-terminal cleavage/methylation domain-containing protein
MNILFRKLTSKGATKAFTLLEILLVVGIIAILAGIVIVAINPSKQIATVRNTQRLSDIKQINSALQQYYITNGSYPTSLLGDLTEICDTGDNTTETTCTDLIDLSVLVPTYLAAIPKDPLATTTDYTGYQVIKGSTSGLISLKAKHAELGQTIVLGKEAGGGGAGVNLADGLIAHWTMNDDVDDKVGSNDGTWSSGESYVDSVNAGMSKAVSFDGTNFIDVGNDSSLNSSTFSMSLWAKGTSGIEAYWEALLGKGSVIDNEGWYLIQYQNFLIFHNSQGSFGPSNSNDILADEQWHHIVIQYDGAQMMMYIDNVPQTPDAQTITPSLSTHLFIGDRLNNAGTGPEDNYFRGSIDDVRYYNKILTSTEVSALYNGGAGIEE